MDVATSTTTGPAGTRRITTAVITNTTSSSGFYSRMFQRTPSNVPSGSGLASDSFERGVHDFPSLSLPQQPQPLRSQQQQSRGFLFGGPGEDFPSLLASMNSNGMTSLPRQQSSNSSQQQPVSVKGPSGLSVAVPPSQQQQFLQQRPSSSSTEKMINGVTTSMDYGLLSLLRLVRMTDQQRNSLALGRDPTLLGWNGDPSLFLGSASRASSYVPSSAATKKMSQSSFTNPNNPPNNSNVSAVSHALNASVLMKDDPSSTNTIYRLPLCYYVSPPPLKTGHFAKFQLETVFYIFYALPKDILQAYAAQELHHREWRYHTEHKLWFKRVTPSDGVVISGGGTSAVHYMYFDISTWERRLFTGAMSAAMIQGFLTDEEVTVQFASS